MRNKKAKALREKARMMLGHARSELISHPTFRKYVDEKGNTRILEGVKLRWIGYRRLYKDLKKKT